MFIQTESTPNPATLKFLPGQIVLETGTADFPNAESAHTSPLAQRLFALDGVTGVFLGYDFVSVTKSLEQDWETLKADVLQSLMTHFQSGEPVLNSDSQASGGHVEDSPLYDPEDEEVVAQIKDLLDTRVRPAVAQDGGDITFHGFENGVVYLHMRGACADCPSSTMTLKMGIENLLRHYIPQVGEVRPVVL